MCMQWLIPCIYTKYHWSLLITSVPYNYLSFQDDGITINYCAWECYNSPLPFIWLALEYGYMGLLQIAAVILAFTTRRVKIKVLNDSKSVAVIIYTTSVVLVALVIISFTLDSYIVVTEILFSGGIMLATTVFLAFIFIPKVIRVEILVLHVH